MKRILICAIVLSVTLSAFSCKESNEELLQKAIENPTKVETLELGMSDFRQVPEVIFTFQNLRHLDLRMNQLKVLPEQVGNLKKLETLILYGNELRELPATITDLPKLRNLLAGSNEFTEIPRNLEGIGLETLYLDNNRISLSEEDVERIKTMHNLRTLDLSFNKTLKSLPKNVEDLKFLKSLMLKNVPLEKEDKKRLKKLLPQTKLEI